VRPWNSRSVRKHRQFPKLNQPFAVAFDEVVFRAPHRSGDHLAVVAFADGLSVRVVNGFARFREHDSDVADHVMQIACRLSSRLVIVSALDVWLVKDYYEFFRVNVPAGQIWM
jgi:hypothetical protein